VTTHPPDGIELLPFMRLSRALPTAHLTVKSLTKGNHVTGNAEVLAANVCCASPQFNYKK